MATRSRQPGERDPDMDFVRAFPPRPLRTEADLDAAIAVIDGLIDRELDPG